MSGSFSTTDDRRPGAVAAFALTLGLVAAAAGGADASGMDPAVDVTREGTVTVLGHGFGHGHGMSQHGAQGAAVQGRTWQEIVGFYYPGTEIAARGRWVRVLLSTDPGDDVIVEPAPGLRLRDLGDRTRYELPSDPAISAWRLTGRGAQTVVSRQVDGVWRRWRPEGRAKPVLAGDGQFGARRPLTLLTPSGPKRYRGLLRAASPTPGSSDRDTVNVVRMEGYVKGVVAREMPASWHPEAVKAQAVAARTFAMRSRLDRLKGYWQICDTTSCQVYGGVDSEHPLSNAAVNATRRQVLLHDGRPALTQFSSSTGGRSFSGGLPYLVEQDDPWDAWSGNPYHSWQVTADLRPLASRYGLGDLLKVRVLERTGGGEWGGEVARIVLIGTQGRRTLTGHEMRSALGLRSAWFTVEKAPGKTAASARSARARTMAPRERTRVPVEIEIVPQPLAGTVEPLEDSLGDDAPAEHTAAGNSEVLEPSDASAGATSEPVHEDER